MVSLLSALVPDLVDLGPDKCGFYPIHVHLLCFCDLCITCLQWAVKCGSITSAKRLCDVHPSVIFQKTEPQHDSLLHLLAKGYDEARPCAF